MIRRFAFIVALAAAAIAPGPDGPHVTAQDAVPGCASAFWLAPVAAEAAEADDAAPAQITEPAPAWMTADLTDACSGDTFALADFAGKTLFVETMATWCPSCHGQLTRLKEAAAALSEEQREGIVFVALSTEVDLPREMLADYAAANDFPFVFAVMPADMLQAMADDLGQGIAIPPATPYLIVAPDGTVGDLRTGGASVEDLLGLFAEAPVAAS
jgi:thiol-disulfide isomerase/thioredoxin